MVASLFFSLGDLPELRPVFVFFLTENRGPEMLLVLPIRKIPDEAD